MVGKGGGNTSLFTESCWKNMVNLKFFQPFQVKMRFIPPDLDPHAPDPPLFGSKIGHNRLMIHVLQVIINRIMSLVP